MQELDFKAITIEPVNIPPFIGRSLHVHVLRLDKIHPLVSGNKWFKLKYYLHDARKKDKTTIVTVGGAWSNHILATAVACKLSGFHSIGIIRGEKPATFSYTLSKAQQAGMKFRFISRYDYAEKKYPADTMNKGHYFIPEGGYGSFGVVGAGEILDNDRFKSYDYICCAAGTGTMTAGLATNRLPQQEIISYSVLKNNTDLDIRIKDLTGPGSNFRVIHDYHFGGYAKYTKALLEFMNHFYAETGIPSDFVYTGKLFAGVYEYATSGFFPAGSRVLIIHSGGLTGNYSLTKGLLIF